MEKNKFIINARSKRNGIVFYSNIFPFIGMEAIFSDSETIQTNIVDQNLEKFFDYLGTLHEGQTKPNKKWIIIFDATILFLSIILSVVFKKFGFVLGALYFSVFVSIDLYNFVNSAISLKKKEKLTIITSCIPIEAYCVISFLITYSNRNRTPRVRFFAQYNLG